MTTYHIQRPTYQIQRQSVQYVGEPYAGTLSSGRSLNFSDLDVAKRVVVKLRERSSAEWCIWDADTKQLALGVDLFKKTQKA